MKTVLKIAREREREREREFWLKYCTFAWGPVTPPCIGGEARGYLGAVPPRELPSPFPAVPEHHVCRHRALRNFRNLLGGRPSHFREGQECRTTAVTRT